MEKLKKWKPRKQAENPKQHDIIKIETPPNSNKRGPKHPTPPTKAVEVDLASDLEDEAGRHSYSNSIHIDDDMEIDQDIIIESHLLQENQLQGNHDIASIESLQNSYIRNLQKNLQDNGNSHKRFS